MFSVPRDKTGSHVLGKHLATELLYLLVVIFLFVLRQGDDL